MRIKKNDIKINKPSNIIKLDVRSIFFIFFVSFIPIILVTFRSQTTGADTHSYIDHFNLGLQYMDMVSERDHEYIFWGLYKIFVKIGAMRLAFFTFAFLTIYTSFIAIYKLSYRYDAFLMSFIFLLLFYQDCFNIVRQMIAIGIVFISICYIYEKKPIFFYGCIVAASLFHSSAIFCFPMYFMYRYKERKRIRFNHMRKITNIVTIIVGIYFFVNFLKIRVFIEENIGFIRFAELESEISTNIGWLKSFAVSFIIYVVIFYIQKTNKYEWNNEDKDDVSFLWGLSFVYLITILLRVYINWTFRIGLYYEIGTILLISKLCKNKERYTLSNKSLTINRQSIYALGYYVVYFFLHNCYTIINSSALVNFNLSF